MAGRMPWERDYDQSEQAAAPAPWERDYDTSAPDKVPAPKAAAPAPWERDYDTSAPAPQAAPPAPKALAPTAQPSWQKDYDPWAATKQMLKALPKETRRFGNIEVDVPTPMEIAQLQQEDKADPLTRLGKSFLKTGESVVGAAKPVTDVVGAVGTQFPGRLYGLAKVGPEFMWDLVTQGGAATGRGLVKSAENLGNYLEEQATSKERREYQSPTEKEARAKLDAAKASGDLDKIYEARAELEQGLGYSDIPNDPMQMTKAQRDQFYQERGVEVPEPKSWGRATVDMLKGLATVPMHVVDTLSDPNKPYEEKVADTATVLTPMLPYAGPLSLAADLGAKMVGERSVTAPFQQDKTNAILVGQLLHGGARAARESAEARFRERTGREPVLERRRYNEADVEATDRMYQTVTDLRDFEQQLNQQRRQELSNLRRTSQQLRQAQATPGQASQVAQLQANMAQEVEAVRQASSALSRTRRQLQRAEESLQTHMRERRFTPAREYAPGFTTLGPALYGAERVASYLDPLTGAAKAGGWLAKGIANAVAATRGGQPMTKAMVEALLRTRDRPQLEALRRGENAVSRATADSAQRLTQAAETLVPNNDSFFRVSSLMERLVNEGRVRMDPQAPSGSFFVSAEDNPAVQAAVRHANQLDEGTTMFREMHRTSQESLASGGFAGRDLGGGQQEANLYVPNYYSDEAYAEAVYNRLRERGLSPREAGQWPGSVADRPMTDAEARLYLEEQRNLRVVDTTPGDFRLGENRIPVANAQQVAANAQSGPSGSPIVEGRALLSRNTRDMTPEERVALGMSTDPRQMAAALHKENIDSARRQHLWGTLAQDPNSLRSLPTEGWVRYDNAPRVGQYGGRPFGNNLPNEFWVSPDVHADMSLIQNIHRLRSSSLLGGTGNAALGAVNDFLRGFSRVHTTLKPGSYAVNYIGDNLIQLPQIGINPYDPRFMKILGQETWGAMNGVDTPGAQLNARMAPAVTQGASTRLETNPEEFGRQFTAAQGLIGPQGRLGRIGSGTRDVLQWAGIKTASASRQAFENLLARARGQTPANTVPQYTREQGQVRQRAREALKTAMGTPGAAYGQMDKIPEVAGMRYLVEVKGMDPARAAELVRTAIGDTASLPGWTRYMSLVIPFTFSFPAAQLWAAAKLMTSNPARAAAWVESARLTEHESKKQSWTENYADVRRRGKYEGGRTLLREAAPGFERDSAGDLSKRYEDVDLRKYMPGEVFIPNEEAGETWLDVPKRLISRDPVVDVPVAYLGYDLAKSKQIGSEEFLRKVTDMFIPFKREVQNVEAAVAGNPARGKPTAQTPSEAIAASGLGLQLQGGETKSAKQRADQQVGIGMISAASELQRMYMSAEMTTNAAGFHDKVEAQIKSLEALRNIASAKQVKGIDGLIKAYNKLLNRDVGMRPMQRLLDAANRPMAE